MAVGTLAIGGAPPALRWLYAMRELQHEAVLRLLEPRQGELPKKAFEAAAQVQYGVSVFFDNASRVNLVWQKTTFDRSRPDDSILLLICVLGVLITRSCGMPRSASPVRHGAGMP